MKSTISTVFPYLRLFIAGAVLVFSSLALHAAPPVINSIPAQSVPCGKALVIPVTSSGNGPLSFTVTSSNPKIIPLIKTGNPYLKFSITYAGNGDSSLAFSGTLIFQLFRDLTPKTVGFISGFAQAGFYDNVIKTHTSGTAASGTGTYNSSTFHRIAQLDPTQPTSFIAQGGDPDANDLDPNSVESFSLPHGPGFNFDNEFSLPLIFVGKGQLAMANSNGTSGYKGTNGSQFFITVGPLRFLDFNHTIFGQLVRDDQGILDKIMAVPATSSRPNVDVVMNTVSLVKDDTDAVLFLSAAGMTTGTTNVTVTAHDPAGNSAANTFAVSTFKDTVNDPPILDPVANMVAPFMKTAHLPFTAEDLEFDFLFPGATFVSNPRNATGALNGNSITVTPNASAPIGRVVVGMTTEQFGPVLRSGSADRTQAVVGLGVRTLSPLNSLIHTGTGAPISHGVVASFRAAQASGTSVLLSGTINWGDGSALTGGSNVTITRITSPANAFAVSSSHTYGRSGQYPLTVTVNDSLGATVTIANTAIVSDGPLIVFGRELALSGGAISSRELASFTDSGSTGRTSDYAVVIDWGDGAITSGKIRKTPRGFSVFGSHKYFANTSYSIAVTVTKISSAATASAWSSVRVKGVISPHLPPFQLTHLVGQIGSVTKVSDTSLDANNIYMINCGNKKSGPVSVRFYLSDDLSSPLQVRSFSPPLSPLSPQSPISFSISNIIIPPDTSTTGKRLVMELVYSDPIGDFMNFTRFFSSNTLP